MVSAAVDLPVSLVIEVDEIHKELTAVRAGEASRMPALARTGSVGKDSNISCFESHMTIVASLC